MKFFLFLLLPFAGKSQDSLFFGRMPMIDGRVNYTKIIQLDSLGKDQIFAKIKDWAVNSYASQKATLEAEDKDAGYLAYKGYVPVWTKYTGGLLKGSRYEVDVYHTLKFYIKDGKMKIVLTDLQLLSKDFASDYLGSHEKDPIETWLVLVKSNNQKRKTKMNEMYTNYAEELHTKIIDFIDSIILSVKVKKSEFDF